MQDLFPYNFNKHPEIGALVGAIAATWAGIEFTLSHFFTWALGCSPIHGAAAYYSLYNTRARLDMIRGLRPLLFDDAERKTIDKAIELAGRAADIRNLHVHSPYLLRGNDVYQITNIGKRYPHGFKQKLSKKALWEDAAEMAEISKTLQLCITELTRNRPLQLRKETVPQSLRQKFRELFDFIEAEAHQRSSGK